MIDATSEPTAAAVHDAMRVALDRALAHSDVAAVSRFLLLAAAELRRGRSLPQPFADRVAVALNYLSTFATREALTERRTKTT